MRRSTSRYPRTSYGRGGSFRTSSYSIRRGFSRRSLLGATAAVAAAGLFDLFRNTSHSKASTLTNNHPATTPTHTASVSNNGSVNPNTGGASSSATHHHGLHHGHGDAPPPHHHGPSHGHSSARGHSHEPHHHNHGDEQPVTLPRATVRVRTKPIYSLDDLHTHLPHKAIGLTIDDGPDPEWTPKVLRLLDKHNMQASFCVVGIHADSYPRLIRDIHRAGHVLVNHTYTHIQPFSHQTEKRIVAEITRAQRSIEKAAKVTPELFRSPGGDWSHFVYRAIAAYGLSPLDWDVDPRDWARPGTTAIEQAMLRGRPGDIVLCHDGGGDRSETVRALRKVLPTWKHRGYKTVPLILPTHTKH